MTTRILFILSILCLIFVTDLMAPELTERDIFGFETYRVEESGAICDKDGAVKGWIQGNTVYDAQWNVKYHIRGNLLSRGDG